MTAPAAVLFDRDGTIVVNVHYNGDPDRVEPMPGAKEALDRLRAAGVKVGVISNQSGVGRGYITIPDVEAVNARVEELLGPFGALLYCPHGPEEGCACRKPLPGMARDAAARLGVAPEACAVVGDQPADMGVARAVGGVAVLVPSPDTQPGAAEQADRVTSSLAEAVDWLLGDGAGPRA